MEFYSIICKEVVSVSSLEIAESAKLLENIQRSVNIGLMNEMKLFTDKMGLNIFEIIEAAGTKPLASTDTTQARSWGSLYTDRSFLSDI